MRFENWTSVADSYVSCIYNSWELELPRYLLRDHESYPITLNRRASVMLNVELKIINK